MAKSTQYVTASGELFYAKVFPQNMDKNPEYHEKTQGSYNTIFVPDSDEELDKFLNAGFPKEVLGTQMVRPYDVAGGRKGIKLKRPNVHPNVEDFGGAPPVYDFTQGEASKDWDFDVDGALGNGTKAKVKVTIHDPGKPGWSPSIRLDAVAILKHVPFVDSAPGW
tara:strand:+ start:4433 stop:4927 length:495 start_codon:yes stop_codon:yes gene_type:complete